jgi:Phage tail assembly chaperone protein
MTLYTKNGSYPQQLPFRIRLSNGMTRTEPNTFTAEEIADAGYNAVPPMPVPNSVQAVEWNYTNSQWLVRDKTLEELQAETAELWNNIRKERDKRINEVAWRYERWERLNRLGLEQIDDINELDNYVQALADLPQTQTDPYDIVWPVYNSIPTANSVATGV